MVSRNQQQQIFVPLETNVSGLPTARGATSDAAAVSALMLLPELALGRTTRAPD